MLQGTVLAYAVLQHCCAVLCPGALRRQMHDVFSVLMLAVLRYWMTALVLQCAALRRAVLCCVPAPAQDSAALGAFHTWCMHVCLYVTVALTCCLSP